MKFGNWKQPIGNCKYWKPGNWTLFIYNIHWIGLRENNTI
jgi:hypothetical protein